MWSVVAAGADGEDRVLDPPESAAGGPPASEPGFWLVDVGLVDVGLVDVRVVDAGGGEVVVGAPAGAEVDLPGGSAVAGAGAADSVRARAGAGADTGRGLVEGVSPVGLVGCGGTARE